MLLKRRPKTKVSPELIVNTWLDLQDFYYSETNKNGFESFKRNLSKIHEIKNEILKCKAGQTLARYNQDSGYDILEKYGVKSKDDTIIKSEIFRRETKLRLHESRMNKTDEQEAVKFYEMLPSIESQLGYQIKGEGISLERWVGIINHIKNKNKAEKTAYEKSKRSKRGRR